jgi:glutamate carboxypeptidase
MDREAPAMEAMLEELVNRDSGSYDIEEVNALGDFLAGELASMGCAVTRYRQHGAAYPVAGRYVPEGVEADARSILLVGHRDTVFPAGTAKTRPFSRDGSRFYGPGVADMKGGIVAGLFAMKAVIAMQEQTGPVPMEIVLTSDEEIGSSVSGPVLLERCKTAKAAFFLEPARANGAVVTARDGSDIFRVDVYGKAAHAGISFSEGISAVNCLAGIIAALAALSNDANGFSVNIGLVGGGSGAAIVPDHAWCMGSTRYASMEQRRYLLERFNTIVESHNRDGLRVALDCSAGYLPLPVNAANAGMFALVREAGSHFGLALEGVHTKGSGDAGLASAQGVPTICGMGPIGGNLHTDEEYLEAASLPERAKVLALSIALAAERLD